MSLIRYFGCDQYETDADMQKDGWSSTQWGVIYQSTTLGRYGGGCIKANRAIIGSFNYLLTGLVNHSTFITQFAVSLDQTQSNNQNLILVRSGGVNCAEVEVNTNGTWTIKRVGGVVVATTPAISFSQYHYVELKVIVGDSGRIVLRVDGEELADVSGVDTKPGAGLYVDEIRLHGPGDESHDACYDDIVILDGSGDAPWNDFLGDCRIISAPVNGPGNSTGVWSGTGSPNWQQVAADPGDAIPGSDDGDSTTISTSGTGDLEQFTVDTSELDYVPQAIYAVSVTTTDKSSDGGTALYQNVMRSGGGDDFGANITPLSVWSIHQTIWEKDPNGGSPQNWGKTAVENMQIGAKRIT